jgi:type II secretory pathway pseudopilin PulG
MRILKSNFSFRSFTIIELLVVISITVLLASIIIISVKDAREKARIAKIMEFSQSVQSLLGVDAVGIWNFDEQTSGICSGATDTVYDSSGYDNDGTCQGDPEWVKSDISGSALKFDGNDYVDVGNVSELNFERTDPFTISSWVKRDTIGVGSPIISKMDGDHGWTFHIGGTDRLTLFLVNLWVPGDKILLVTGSKLLNDTAWHHVVVTYDGSSSSNGVKFYIDGEEDPLSTPLDQINVSIVNNGPIKIGGYVWGNIEGTIDELRVYNTVLSSAFIQKLYVQGVEKRGLAKFD